MFALHLEKSPTIERTQAKIQVFKGVVYVKYVFYTLSSDGKCLYPTQANIKPNED